MCPPGLGGRVAPAPRLCCPQRRRWAALLLSAGGFSITQQDMVHNQVRIAIRMTGGAQGTVLATLQCMLPVKARPRNKEASVISAWHWCPARGLGHHGNKLPATMKIRKQACVALRPVSHHRQQVPACQHVLAAAGGRVLCGWWVLERQLTTTTGGRKFQPANR